jgi:cell division protein FtsB
MVAKKGRRALVSVLAVLLFVAGLAAYVLANLNPIVISMAEARARQLAVRQSTRRWRR